MGGPAVLEHIPVVAAFPHLRRGVWREFWIPDDAAFPDEPGCFLSDSPGLWARGFRGVVLAVLACGDCCRLCGGRRQHASHGVVGRGLICAVERHARALDRVMV